MIYLITEDATSGRYFWDNVVKTFKNNVQQYGLIQSPNGKYGNTMLKQMFNIAIDKAISNDTILIAFDNVNSKSFDVSKFLSICKNNVL